MNAESNLIEWPFPTDVIRTWASEADDYAIRMQALGIMARSWLSYLNAKEFS